jgi:hypothetical protein
VNGNGPLFVRRPRALALAPWQRRESLSEGNASVDGRVRVFFAVDTLRNAPETFTAIVAIAALAVILDLIWKRVRQEPPPATAAAPMR